VTGPQDTTFSQPLRDFLASVDFEPDAFQVEAATAIAEGNTVVVTAPTGSGKTLIAEAGIHLTLRRGLKSFYTTPIKALSNQKYADFAATYGPERVGLLTGDNVVNPGAPVIVATLEVLRNMIYADRGHLDDVGLVILDEAHYLQDRSRGAAWEEVIIHCPPHVQFVCLSATISNNTEFTAWVGERRGSSILISTDHRPVPLHSTYMIKDRMGGTLHLLPTFVTRDGRTRPNGRIEHMLGLEKGGRKRFATPHRTEVIERLAGEGMLPAIYFIFSRAGCDAAAMRLVDSGIRLTDREERSAIREIVDERTAHLQDSDLEVLGFSRWIAGLEAGVASHHAGLVPAFKETVEELFELGLLKVVFATETLALGINMPARSVVLEALSKFTGESHEMLRPGDYTQLTGRAGRRGIDVEGFGVVLHSPFVRFSEVTQIASLGSHELVSSFKPTYNMTANLIANYDRENAERLLEASFSAYQREGDIEEAKTMIDALEHQLAREEEAARCDRGDVEEYLALIEALEPKQRNDGIANGLGAGDVVQIVGGRRDGRYAVLQRLARKDDGIRYLALSTSGSVTTMGFRDITAASYVVGRITLPTPFRPRDRRFVQATLRDLRKVKAQDGPRPKQGRKLVEHPVADCPDAARHLAALRRALRTRRKLEQHLAMARRAGHTLVDEFRSIHGLLEDLDYTSDWQLTPRGDRLRRLYNESDLLLAEAIERGCLYGMEPAELAALLSVFVYEPRTDQESPADWPTPELHDRWAEIQKIWSDLASAERSRRLNLTRRPDPGFGLLAYMWASGTEFDLLPTKGMAAGDFVRVSRQLADLLRQVRDGIRELSDDARAALVEVDRGVVAAQGVG
jgi:ATP-dependent RNA helicase HelY